MENRTPSSSQNSEISTQGMYKKLCLQADTVQMIHDTVLVTTFLLDRSFQNFKATLQHSQQINLSNFLQLGTTDSNW